MDAVREGSEDVVKLLVGAGAAVDIQNRVRLSHNQHFLAYKWRVLAANRLIVRQDGYTALMLAASARKGAAARDSVANIQCLLRAGADCWIRNEVVPVKIVVLPGQ
jgi:ankyrin repeat protein